MASLSSTSRRHQARDTYYLDILCESDSGSWVLALPPMLKQHQTELEGLIDKVFSGKPTSKENFSLAQQLSLNWCFSKARQWGVALEDCWGEA